MADRLRAALFDFDDTLIDWSGVELDWREIEAPRLASVLAYLQSQDSCPPLELEQLVDVYTERTYQAWSAARRSLRSPNMPQILLEILTELGIADAPDFRDEILDAYDWQVVAGTVVFPDVPPMLEQLRGAGLKLGIVTNSSQPMALRDAELRGHGLLEYFPDCRLAAADIGWLKPHRRIFEEALARLGTTAAETIFIGDNPRADIAGALAVGMRAVQRIGPYDAPPAADDARRASLSSLEQLPPILDRWFPDWRHG